MSINELCTMCAGEAGKAGGDHPAGLPGDWQSTEEAGEYRQDAAGARPRHQLLQRRTPDNILV